VQPFLKTAASYGGKKQAGEALLYKPTATTSGSSQT